LFAGCGGETKPKNETTNAASPTPDQFLEAGLKGLTDEDPLRRRLAAMSLANGGAKAKEALPELKKLLNDPDADVRKVAAEAVKQIESAK
jgi:HEAT repeat protein